MIYARLAVTPSDPARRDAVSAALFAAGAEGLLEDGPRFVTVFADAAAAQVAADAARAVDDSVLTSCEPYDPGDWTEAWRRGVGAHAVGRLTIAPPWLASASPTATTIVIEPGMGFGTGEHETTRLAVSLLQRVIRSGDVVADAGCGSAILSIAAAKLGAGRVAAIEVDPLAIANAEENVALNAVSDRVSVIEGDAAALLPLLAPVRVIVANIVAPVLRELLPVFERALAPDGDVIVGGVLGAERDSFVADAAVLRWCVAEEMSEGDWWSAHLRRATE